MVGAIVWPVFLFVAVEILARVVWPHGWSWGFVRWAGLLPVAGVAAFVSYRHMSGLLAHYGEEPVVYYIGPLAVDGLMIMATAALMAGGRAARATATAQTETVTQPTATIPVAPVVAAVVAPATQPEPGRPPVVTQPVATRQPEPMPVPAPAHASSPPAPQPKPAAATAVRSTTDTPVTASDPDRRPSQLAPGLVARGRYIAEAHRKHTGDEIGANELAVKLRVSTGRAKQVLAALANNTAPASANGNRPTAAVPG